MTHPNKAFYNGMNEGGDGYNPYDYEDSPETQAALAADATRFAAEWTPEVTAERRAAWNAWVRTHPGYRLNSVFVTWRSNLDKE